jgi:hypothetical protein
MHQNVATDSQSSPKPSLVSSKFLVVLSVIALLILTGIGSYVLGTRSSQPPTNIFPAHSTVQISPVPTADETVNWKKYSNTKYSFSYPSNWVLSGTDKSQQFYLNQTAASLKGPDYIMLVSTFDKKFLKLTFADPIGKKVNPAEQVFTQKTENITVGGYPAFKTKTEVLKGSGTETSPGVGLFVDLGTDVLSLSMRTDDPQVDSKIFDQIINTFKIIDSAAGNQDQTVNTSDWKTYTNTSYGYSIQYPSSWKIEDKTAMYSPQSFLNAQVFNDDGNHCSDRKCVNLLLWNNLDLDQAKRGGGDAGHASTAKEVKTETVNGIQITKVVINYTELNSQTEKWEDAGTSYILYIPVKGKYLSSTFKLTQ